MASATNELEIDMNEQIQKLHDRGFSTWNWTFDQEIGGMGGAWYGRIGSPVYMVEYKNAIVLFDHGSNEILIEK